ncbi:NUDIX hydrolase [Epibacterium ulvae]|uniref:NUDIX hydrolase n=1 Tax=Epibacterium ulvae TaxID=1156985 RepID=UPI00333FEC65
MFSNIWEEYLRPMLLRPKRLQVAALCYRHVGDTTEVLMITSRGTGRWIIPKGWPMDGKTCAQAALQEAWEEAGVVKAEADENPIGSFDYHKLRATGIEEPVTALIYAAKVQELSNDYPEVHQRKRQWMPADEAATLVHEPALQKLLRGL